MNTRTTRRAAARLCAVAVATVALTAAVASPASAVSWNAPGTAKASGTLTFSTTGQPDKACTLANVPSLNAYGAGGLTGQIVFTASCGGFVLSIHGSVSNPASWTFSSTGSVMGANGPFGPWTQYAILRPWTNATATVPSKVGFSNTLIGNTQSGGGNTYVNGTASFTTAAGGVLKVNP